MYQQLLQYTAIHPSVNWVETKAVLRDQSSCKFFCFVPLSLCLLPSSHSTCVFFAEKPFELNIGISSDENRKIGYNFCKMQ
jgi:hypothetical protein